MASKGQGEFGRCRSLEQGEGECSGEHKHTPEGNRDEKPPGFLLENPSGQSSCLRAEVVKEEKKKKSGKGASQRDLLEKKEGKEKWLNPILLILKANSSCLS